MMKPCLAENWFVEDSMEDGTSDHPLLHYFHPTDKEQALREVYRMSRDLRIKRFFSGKIKEAKETSDKASLEVFETITALFIVGEINFRNHRFNNEHSS